MALVNREERRVYQKAWAVANRDRCREKARRYRLKNVAKCKASEQRWRKNNPDKVRAAKRKWAAKNPHKTALQIKKWRMKTRYRTTPEDVQRAREVQNDRCAICRRCVELVIDHDHTNGGMRALLCRACNLMIGYAHEDPLVLERAAAYVTPYGKMTPMEDPAA